MHNHIQFETDLTVRSFAYVARQLARSSPTPSQPAPYEQITNEAEKHRCALKLTLRDACEALEQALRARSLSRSEFQRACDATAQTIEQAQQAITRVLAQYAPHRLAA